MDKLKLVIAGTHEQYKRYLRETRQLPRNVRYIMDPNQLRGYENVEVVMCGTWYENPCHNDEYLRELISLGLATVSTHKWLTQPAPSSRM